MSPPYCVAVLVLGITSAAAQPRPNFSGLWKLHPAASHMIGGPMGEISWTIDHREPTIAISVNVSNPQGAREFAFKCTTNGKECVNVLRDPDEVRRTTAAWERNVLVMRTKAEGPDGRFEALDRMYISDDGQSLMFDRTVTDSRGERLSKQVFRKQDAKR